MYEYLSEEYDQSWSEATPRRSCIVCSTPRCGSTLLGEGLIASKLAGVPMEYINRVHTLPLMKRWRCVSSLEYLQVLPRRRTGPNGVFGIKLHWSQFASLCHDFGIADSDLSAEAHIQRRNFLEKQFPRPVFVHISRLNRVEQAVSWYVAANTGRWLEREGASSSAPEVPYDFHGILRFHHEIEYQESCWRAFFRANGIRPYPVVYEQFVHDYEGTLRNILRALHQGESEEVEAVALPKPSLRKQANAKSQEFVHRYLEDLRRVTGFPASVPWR